MRASLTFTLPEEEEEFKDATKGASYKSVLHDIANYQRALRKYEERSSVPTEEIINKLTELLAEVDIYE